VNFDPFDNQTSLHKGAATIDTNNIATYCYRAIPFQ
jgi:hypothetical protein